MNPDKEVARLRAALSQIAAEADGGRLSANDDELRDWLMGIRDVAIAALEYPLGLKVHWNSLALESYRWPPMGEK